MHIGILGGSFNPVHNGHLFIARTLLKKNIIEQCWFLPSYNHPVKNREKITFAERLNLLHLALKDIPGCFAYDFDYNETRPSYTALLLQKLSKKFPEYNFSFIIGYDIIPELPKWYRFDWLKENASFLIINRPGNYKTDNLSELKKYILIDIPPQNVSSSLIRKLLSQKKSIQGLIPSQIEEKVVRLYS